MHRLSSLLVLLLLPLAAPCRLAAQNTVYAPTVQGALGGDVDLGGHTIRNGVLAPTVSMTLPPATTAAPGVVKVGSGLAVDGAGTLSLSLPSSATQLGNAVAPAANGFLMTASDGGLRLPTIRQTQASGANTGHLPFLYQIDNGDGIGGGNATFAAGAGTGYDAQLFLTSAAAPNDRGWRLLSGASANSASGTTGSLLFRYESSGGTNSSVWLSPTGDVHAASLNGPLAAGPRTTFVFEGDSISQGYLADHPFSYYAASMSYFTNHGPLYNVAVSASQIPSGSGASGTNNVTDRYTTGVKPHRPSANGGDGGERAVLVLMIGTNDLGSAGKTGAQVIADLTAYASAARADGFFLVLSTLTPRRDGAWTATMEGYRQQVNAAIRNGTIPADLVADFAAALPNPADASLFADALHPATSGQKILARHLNNALAAGGAFVPANGSVAEQLFNAPQGIATTTLGANNVQIGGASVSASSNYVLATYDPNYTAFGQAAWMMAVRNGGLNGGIGFPTNASVSYGIDCVIAATSGSSGNNIYTVTPNIRAFASGNTALGTSTDDGANKLQVAGSAKITGTVTGGRALFDGGLSPNIIQSGMSPSNIDTYPLVVKNTSATGITAIDFLDNVNTQRGTIGYGAASSPFYANVGLWLSHDAVYFCDAGLGNWFVFDFPNHKARVGDGALPATDVFEVAAGNLSVVTAGKTLKIASGSNALAGTVTLSSGAATITSSAIDANTVIVLTLKTSSGTPGTFTPRTSVAAGSATVTGNSGDNSTYNWIGLKVN